MTSTKRYMFINKITTDRSQNILSVYQDYILTMEKILSFIDKTISVSNYKGIFCMGFHEYFDYELDEDKKYFYQLTEMMIEFCKTREKEISIHTFWGNTISNNNIIMGFRKYIEDDYIKIVNRDHYGGYDRSSGINIMICPSLTKTYNFIFPYYRNFIIYRKCFFGKNLKDFTFKRYYENPLLNNHLLPLGKQSL